MANKNNPDIYISAIWAMKKRLMGICLMVVPLAVPNGDLSYGCTPVSGYRGSVLWLYPCQWLSGICLMVVPLEVPKQTMNDRLFM